jgi:GH25 family lysozyme M1 (1,4-beta-N-acetylmuramidase)
MADTTSRGLDVSAYQGAQDWNSWARGGMTFAFAKASEGQHSRDSRFATHITGIIEAGLIPGAYHYGWPSQDAAAEAANYADAVKPFARPGFIHILDLERRSDGANYGGRSSSQVRAWAETWIARVRAAYSGQRVIVYTSADDIAAGRMPSTADALWYPAYPSGAMSYPEAEAHARPAPGGLHPLFWQFTSTPLDRSIAYLAPAELRAWALGTTTQPHQEDDMPLNAEDKTWIQGAIKTALDVARPEFANATWKIRLVSPTATDPKNSQRFTGDFLRWGDQHAADIVKAVHAQQVPTLTAAQVTAIAAQVAASPALAAAIAEQVAEKIAARLAK